MNQTVELNELRGMLRRALGMVDALITNSPARGSDDDVSRFRERPGGPLNDEGIAEVNRRFEAGESDSRIALDMAISLVGVARRRAVWRKTAASSGEDEALRFRERPGGPLNDEGIAEVNRRFQAGESDSRIAREMAISLVGVARRRAVWRKSQAN